MARGNKRIIKRLMKDERVNSNLDKTDSFENWRPSILEIISFTVLIPRYYYHLFRNRHKSYPFD